MGYIKSLTLENFKSFRGVTTIEPFERWNSVVGPNGSGKSNFFEAIAFVLYSKGYRLKDTSAKEFIHKDELSNQKENMASVTLVYQLEDEDKTDELTSDIMVFKRIVTSTGFTYQIDGIQRTIDEYKRTLRSLSITPSTCLIFQTQVNEISQKEDKKLGEEFEEISGSIEFKGDIDNMKKEKEEIEEKIKDNFKKIQGINNLKKIYNNQYNEYENYTTCKQQLSDLEIQVNLQKIHYYHSNMIKSETEIADLENKMVEDENRKVEINEQLKTLKKEIAKCDGKLSQKKEEINLSNKENYRDNKLTLESNIDSINKAIKKLEKEIEKKVNKLSDLENTLVDVQADIEENQKARDRDDKQIDALVQQTTNSNTSSSFMQLNTQYNNEVADYIKRQKILNENKDNMLKSIRNQQNNINSIDSEISKTMRDRDNDISSKEELEEQQNEINKENVIKNHEIEKLKKELESNRKTKEELEKVNKQKEEEIMKLSQQISINKYEQQMEKAKNELFKKYKDKIVGEFLSLVKINQDEYYEAITTALGKYNNAIVIKEKKDAKDMIDHITKLKLPVITFIPLDNIQIPVVSDSDRNNFRNTNFHLAIDLITVVKNECRDLGKYALGTTVICNTIKDAIHFVRNHNDLRYRFVSKDGMIMNKNRCITGGSNSSNSANYHNKNNYEALQAERDENQREIDKILKLCSRNGENSIIAKINNLENDISNNNNNLKNIINPSISMKRSRIAGYKSKLDNLNAEKKKCQSEIQKYANDINAIDRELKSIEEEMNKIHQNIFGGLSQDGGSNEAIIVLRQRVDDLQNKRLSYDRQLTSLKESVNTIHSDIERLKSEISTFENAIQEKNMNMEELREELKKIEESQTNEKNLEKLKQEIDSLQSTKQGYEKDRDDLKNELHHLKQEYTSNLEDINRYKNTITQMKSNIHDILNMCKTTGIQLPINNNNNNNNEGGGSYSESQDIMMSQSTQSTIEERLLIDNKLIENIDFSLILKKNNNQNNYNDESFKKMIDECEGRITTLKQSLINTNPNGKAADNLAECKKELLAVQEISKDLNRKKEKVEKQLQDLIKRRNERFNELFEVVEQNINNIYNELSKSSNDSEGGTAYIHNLSNENEKKIQYSVNPANKRVDEMSKLSGGEKAIASLALLFAIHKYQKTPFIVMDEIDAELDNNNVKNVQRYILNHKNEIQFITVSLKDILFCESDSLIGIYKKDGKSNVLCLNMNNFD